MRSKLALTSMAASVLPAAAWAQGLWEMHDRLDWGIWFGPLFMLLPLALVILAIVVFLRWLGRRNDEGGRRVHSPRDIPDERYALGQIDREEYLRRSDRIAGRS